MKSWYRFGMAVEIIILKTLHDIIVNIKDVENLFTFDENFNYFIVF